MQGGVQQGWFDEQAGLGLTAACHRVKGLQRHEAKIQAADVKAPRGLLL